MAGPNWTTITEANWSSGIDQQSPENKIPAGYSEDILNMDPLDSGQLVRRRGSQSFIGQVPIRVTSIQQTAAGKLLVSLPDGTDLTNISSTPVLIRGTSSIEEFDGVSASEGRWYPSFSTDIRRTAPANSTTTFTFLAGEHGKPYGLLAPVLVSIWEALDTTTSNEKIIPDSVVLDTATGTVTVTIINGRSTDLNLFFSFRTSQEAGVVYTSNALSIPASTHGLSNPLLTIKTFKQNGLLLEEVVPESATINNIGDVTVSFLGAGTFVTTLIANNLANQFSGSIAAETSDSLSLGDIGSFNEVFITLDTGAGNKELVIPDSVIWDSVTGETTVSFENQGPSASFTIYWESRKVVVSSLILDAITSVGSLEEDILPQLVLYGLDQATIWESGSRAGWVTALDSYKSAGEAFLVASVNGNFFRDSQTKEVVLFPNLRTRTTSSVFVGPAFSDGPTDRTRGNLVASAAGAGWLKADKVTYVPSTQKTEFRIPLSSYSFDVGFAEPGDILTVQGGSFKIHNGDWVIDSITTNPTNLTVSVTIPSMNSDKNDDGCAAQVGIFSDIIPVTSSELAAGDSLITSVLLNQKVIANGGTELLVSNCDTIVQVPTGLLVLAKRTSDTIRIRDSLGVPTVDNLVVGDTLSVVGESTKVIIKSVDDSNKEIVVSREVEWKDTAANEQVLSIDGRWVIFESPTPSLQSTESDALNHPFLNSSMAGDNLYFTDGVSSVKKVTGENVLDTGLPKWQIQAFLIADEAPTDTPTGLIPVDVPEGITYSYYYRLNTIDENDNIVASNVVGSTESRIRLARDAQIRHKIIGLPPKLSSINTDRLEVEIYRTFQDQVTPFFKIATIPFAATPYVEFVDAIPDIALRENDALAINFTGAELPTAIQDPLPAKYLTSVNNSLVSANLIGRPKAVLSFRGKISSLVPVNEYLGMEMLIRKNSEDTGTSLEPENRLKVITTTTKDSISLADDAGSLRVNGLSSPLAVNDIVYLFAPKQNDLSIPPSGIDVGTDVITSTAHGLIDGQQVFVESLPTGFLPLLSIRFGTGASTAYTVQVLSANTFKLVGIDILAAGTAGFLKIVPSTAINLRYQGWFRVKTVISATDVTLDTPYLGVSPSDVNAASYSAGFIPIYLGIDDLGYGQIGGNLVSEVGATDLVLKRIATGLNWASHLAAKNWISSFAGADVDGPSLVLEFRNLDVSSAAEVIIPDTTSTTWQVFGNGILRDPSASVSSRQALYPSRLVFSYPNFPDMVDDPEVENDSNSPLVVDVNSNDGQEITKILPLFGESAFGSANKDSVILVFKTNSIYLVNLAAKKAGENAVQRLDSRGMGLDIPGAAAPSKNGVLFLNTNGAFRVTSQLEIEPTGNPIVRITQGLGLNVNTLAAAHHSPLDQQWKVSLPESSTTLVYCHDKESAGNTQGRASMGAWTKHSGRDAIGWANLNGDEFSAHSGGDIRVSLRTNTAADYADLDTAFKSSALLRAMDFGDGGLRKVVSYAILKWRVSGDIRDILVSALSDLSSERRAMDVFELDLQENSDNLSDSLDVPKIVDVRYSLPNRKAVHFQLEISTEAIRQPMELTEVSWRVSGLSDKGIQEAAVNRKK